MRRPWLMCGLVVGLGWHAASPVWAASTAEKAAPAVKAEAEAPGIIPSTPAQTTERMAKEKIVDEWRDKLNGTAWALTLKAKGIPPQQDTVTFTNRQISSEALTKEGFGSSNYSLRVEDDGTVTWETMQRKGDEAMAFWRGELRGEVMTGALDKRPTVEGPTSAPPQEFGFTASKTARVEPPAPAVPAAPIAAAPAAVAPAEVSAPAPVPAPAAASVPVAVAPPAPVQVPEVPVASEPAPPETHKRKWW